MLSQTPAAIHMRAKRAAMTPEQREALRAYNREWSKKAWRDPAKHERMAASRRATYRRAMANPVKAAAYAARTQRQLWENAARRMVQDAKRRAAKRGLQFDLTPQWADATWTGKCAVTGLSFVLRGRRHNFSPSLDRINNTRGYTQDNCRWVLWAVNLLKHTGTDAEMFEIAKAIATRSA